MPDGTRRFSLDQVNINTVMHLITLAVALGTAVWYGTNYTRDIDDLQSWRDRHELLHKERLAEVTGLQAKAEERFRNLEAEVRKIEQLSYRVTVTEQSGQNTAQALRDLQSTVNSQASDIRFALEILRRLEGRLPGETASPRRN